MVPSWNREPNDCSVSEVRRTFTERCHCLSQYPFAVEGKNVTWMKLLNVNGDICLVQSYVYILRSYDSAS